jgi:hypothetical protein
MSATCLQSYVVLSTFCSCVHMNVLLWLYVVFFGLFAGARMVLAWPAAGHLPLVLLHLAPSTVESAPMLLGRGVGGAVVWWHLGGHPSASFHTDSAQGGDQAAVLLPYTEMWRETAASRCGDARSAYEVHWGC